MALSPQSFCQQVVVGARQLLLLSGGMPAFYQSSTLSHTVQPWDLCDARLHSRWLNPQSCASEEPDLNFTTPPTTQLVGRTVLWTSSWPRLGCSIGLAWLLATIGHEKCYFNIILSCKCMWNVVFYYSCIMYIIEVRSYCALPSKRTKTVSFEVQLFLSGVCSLAFKVSLQ